MSCHHFVKTSLMLIASLVAFTAHAQPAYPEKPIKLIVPWPAGGSSDTAARLIAKHLQDRLKQTVLVDNKPGASGNIGTLAVAKAAPDGYTLLLSSGPFSVNPSLYRSLPFNTLRDFTPVAQVSLIPSVLVVLPSFSASSMTEFVALAKNKSAPMAYASPGNGTAQHLAMELLRQKADLSLTHVPYKGGGPALIALMSGEIDMSVLAVVAVASHVNSGRMRVLAVTSGKRMPSLPNIPTVAESGLANYEFNSWVGIVAPTSTPASIIKILNEHIVRAARTPDVIERFAKDGTEVVAGTPEQFKKVITDEVALWSRIIRQAGIRAD